MKTSHLLFAAAAISLLFTHCRQNEDNFLGYWVAVNGQFEYIDIDEAPAYRAGGEEGFNLALADALVYPPEARDNGVEGCVELEYEISESGTVENIIVLSDPGSGLGAAARAAIEVITEGQPFEPATLHGKPVRVLVEKEVCFSLG